MEFPDFWGQATHTDLSVPKRLLGDIALYGPEDVVSNTAIQCWGSNIIRLWQGR